MMWSAIQTELSGSGNAVINAIDHCRKDVLSAAQAVNACVVAGGRVLVAGNGGSASQAQHFAAELMGRFERNREPFPAVALTADSAAITAIANDWTFDDVFARQVEALGHDGDVFIAISTTGNSRNIVEAAMVARGIGLYVIALTGRHGGELTAFGTTSIRVPSVVPSYIQVAHLAILHAICRAIDEA